MKKVVKLLLLALVGYGIYIILFGTPQLGKPATIEIPKGAGIHDIADLLKKHDLIRSTWGFEAAAWFKGVAQKLQAGEYTFQPGIKLGDIIGMLSQGLGAFTEKEITIVEGWTMKEIGQVLKEQGIVEKKESLDLADALSEFRLKESYDWFLKDAPAGASLEGYLFPDTYRFYKNANGRDVIDKMLNNFGKKFTQEMRNDITKQGKTIFDIVRMASIIEAEVSHADDRPIVAGILWKRLDVGMPLQVDSTLNYATGGNHRALTAEELKINSPYNTYKYKGLPPTSIGNSGLSALKAAIYPKHTAYWYFLSGKDTKTYFAKTLDEHAMNKQQYLK